MSMCLESIDSGLPLIRFKKFCELITEANHGIYNKDERLLSLVNLILDDIKSAELTLPFTKISGQINKHTIKTQPPAEYNIKNVSIIWQILKSDVETEFRQKFFEQASVQYNPVNELITINFVFNKEDSQSEKSFKQEIKQFISKDLKEILLHEVKHILDRIDKRISNKTIPRNRMNYEDGKYQSLNKEIYNFLLTLIGEFDKIAIKYPGISFTAAIEKSKWYNKILDPMPERDKKTVKGKLIDFWIDNYGMDTLH